MNNSHRDMIKVFLEHEHNNLNYQTVTKPDETLFLEIKLDNIGSIELSVNRIKQVIQLVNDNSEAWPSYQLWEDILPSWFVNFCEPEMSQIDSDKWLAWWRTLNETDKRKAEKSKGWSLADWLYWLEPKNRVWFYGSIKNQELEGATFTLFSIENAPPLGALGWLIIASQQAQ